MSFILMACTDIRGQKVNVELPFQQPPTSVDSLRGFLERLFREEEEVLKRSMGYTDTRACEPFTINRLQRYDDDTQSWSDVVSVEMLQTYDQLYAFRKNSTRADISTQRELPPPRPSPYFHDPPTQASLHTPRGSSGVIDRPPASVRATSVNDVQGSSVSPIHIRHIYEGNSYNGRVSGPTASASARRPSDPSLPPEVYPASMGFPTPPAPSSSAYYYKERTTPERVEYLFRMGSQSHDGALITVKSFEHILRLAHIAFPAEVAEDLFNHFATTGGHSSPNTAVITEEKFQEFATAFPVLVNIAYQRITNQDREEAVRSASRENGRQLENAKRLQEELEARLSAARREVQQAEQRQARLQEDLYDLSVQRDPEYCQEEQKLLDKEVSVFKYRERLAREERDYERLAIERRKRATASLAHARSNSPHDAYDPNRYGPRD